MRSLKSLVFPGVLIWVVTFIAGMLMFSLHETDRPLFESLIAIVLVLAVLIASYSSFKKVKTRFLNEGVKYGITWVIINIAIDLPIYLNPPINMNTMEYIKDIGISYLVIPVITIGIGFQP